MLKLEYSRQTKSMPWLLMPWLLASPGHQQPWYWFMGCGYSCLSWEIISTTYGISVPRMWNVNVFQCFFSEKLIMASVKMSEPARSNRQPRWLVRFLSCLLPRVLNDLVACGDEESIFPLAHSGGNSTVELPTWQAGRIYEVWWFK